MPDLPIPPGAEEEGPDRAGEAGTDDGLFRSRTAGVWLPRDFVAVAGPDALGFLQGQLSQDIAALGVGSSAWALLLAPQGKVVALLRVLREGDEAFVLDTDGGWGGAVVDRLVRFKLRVRCDIETRGWRCLAIRGDAAHEAADAARIAGQGSDPGAVHALEADWPGLRGVDLVGEDPAVPADLDVHPAELYEGVRIEAGVPVMGRELTEATIPAEAGVVERSVSFTKGCYTGQELVARIDSRGGNVPRRLRGVTVTGPRGASSAPPVGATLRVGGAAAGTLTSVAWSTRLGRHVALAYVRRAVEPPADAELGWEGGAAEARIETLPLVP